MLFIIPPNSIQLRHRFLRLQPEPSRSSAGRGISLHNRQKNTALQDLRDRQKLGREVNSCRRQLQAICVGKAGAAILNGKGGSSLTEELPCAVLPVRVRFRRRIEVTSNPEEISIERKMGLECRDQNLTEVAPRGSELLSLLPPLRKSCSIPDSSSVSGGQSRDERQTPKA